jgi:hypothetical protein
LQNTIIYFFEIERRKKEHSRNIWDLKSKPNASNPADGQARAEEHG